MQPNENHSGNILIDCSLSISLLAAGCISIDKLKQHDKQIEWVTAVIKLSNFIRAMIPITLLQQAHWIVAICSSFINPTTYNHRTISNKLIRESKYLIENLTLF